MRQCPFLPCRIRSAPCGSGCHSGNNYREAPDTCHHYPRSPPTPVYLFRHAMGLGLGHRYKFDTTDRTHKKKKKLRIGSHGRHLGDGKLHQHTIGHKTPDACDSITAELSTGGGGPVVEARHPSASSAYPPVDRNNYSFFFLLIGG